MNHFFSSQSRVLVSYFSRLLLCALMLSTGLNAFAQPQDPVDIVTTDVSLVQLNVGVVDPQGRAVTSLSRNDFAVYEDGIKQPILHFEPTHAPFSLVLLLDMSGSTISFRPQLKQAALRFLDALAPEDRVAVIQFNAKIKMLEDFTTKRKDTAYAIELAEGAGQTHLYDALSYALKELGKEGQRRKAIVVLTDGLDTELRNADRALVQNAQTDAEAIAAIDANASAALNMVLATADRHNVTIFPLALPSGDPKRLPSIAKAAGVASPLPPDPIIMGIYSAARTRLQNLADRTGGKLNEIHRLDQMARLYVDVAAHLRSLYTVAYQPVSGRKRDGKWHEIRVEVTQPALTARTRPGYYSR
jgi:Ca-activated chloride channel family protein